MQKVQFSSVGLFIRERRQELAMTQGQLAQAIGLATSQLISNVERGSNVLPPARMAALCRTLRVEPNLLLKFIHDDLDRRLIETFNQGGSVRKTTKKVTKKAAKKSTVKKGVIAKASKKVSARKNTSTSARA